MDCHYTQKDMVIEKKLYDLVELILKTPGVYIGEPSLSRLFHFIGGYAFAVMQLTGYRFYFEREFQAFVIARFPTKCAINWSEILSEGRTESQAFDLFRGLFSEFRTIMGG